MPTYEKSDTDIDDSQTSEDCESLLSSSSTLTSTSQPSTQRKRATRFLHVFIHFIILPLATLTLGILLGIHLPRKEQACIEQISKYSPILEETPIKFSTVTFNGSLFKSNVFREPAGPAVDAAWESLGVDYRAAIVPTHLAAKADLLPSQVQINPKYHPGGGYLANVEGLHHLHCLNLVRQSLYYNFEYYHARKQGAFKNEDHVLQAHVSHCLDILRQQLQCTVDIGMLGQVWWNVDKPTSFPDFNTRHTCRDFEAVRDWAERNQAPEMEGLPSDYLKVPTWGDVLVEIP